MNRATPSWRDLSKVLRDKMNGSINANPDVLFERTGHPGAVVDTADIVLADLLGHDGQVDGLITLRPPIPPDWRMPTPRRQDWTMDVPDGWAARHGHSDSRVRPPEHCRMVGAA